MSIWRDPPAETEEYPGLVVHDGRVTGSITAGRSRLPLWAFVAQAMRDGWETAEEGWEPSRYGWDAEKMGLFLYNLLECRGELGRLLCILADEHRRDEERQEHDVNAKWWREMPRRRARVVAQLKRCLAALTK